MVYKEEYVIMEHIASHIVKTINWSLGPQEHPECDNILSCLPKQVCCLVCEQKWLGTDPDKENLAGNMSLPVIFFTFDNNFLLQFYVLYWIWLQYVKF